MRFYSESSWVILLHLMGIFRNKEVDFNIQFDEKSLIQFASLWV